MLFIISASRAGEEALFILDEKFFTDEMGVENPSPEAVKDFLFGKSWELVAFVKCPSPEAIVGSTWILPIGFELRTV